MNTVNLIVTFTGLAVIGWIIWYFWLWRGETAAARTADGGIQVIDVTVMGGYQPATIVAKAGRLVRLNFTRREATPCGEEVIFPDFGKRAHLPEQKTVTIEVLPERPGLYEFTCGMNMYRGKLIVE